MLGSTLAENCAIRMLKYWLAANIMKIGNPKCRILLTLISFLDNSKDILGGGSLFGVATGKDRNKF